MCRVSLCRTFFVAPKTCEVICHEILCMNIPSIQRRDIYRAAIKLEILSLAIFPIRSEKDGFGDRFIKSEIPVGVFLFESGQTRMENFNYAVKHSLNDVSSPYFE